MQDTRRGYRPGPAAARGAGGRRVPPASGRPPLGLHGR